jgi:hypothetical protein
MTAFKKCDGHRPPLQEEGRTGADGAVEGVAAGALFFDGYFLKSLPARGARPGNK